jgi:hypothetical protein
MSCLVLSESALMRNAPGSIATRASRCVPGTMRKVDYPYLKFSLAPCERGKQILYQLCIKATRF